MPPAATLNCVKTTPNADFTQGVRIAIEHLEIVSAILLINNVVIIE